LLNLYLSEDYASYQIWDSIQAGASSVNGVLSTRAVLSSIGVGNANTTSTAAVLNWIIRTGSGMMGRVLFSWSQGKNLDCNAKSWRLGADIINDFAMLLELLSPLFFGYALVFFCV